MAYTKTNSVFLHGDYLKNQDKHLRPSFIEHNSFEYLHQYQHYKIGTVPLNCIPVLYKPITVQGVLEINPNASSFKETDLSTQENKSENAFKTLLFYKRNHSNINIHGISADIKETIYNIHNQLNLSPKMVFQNGDYTYDALIQLENKQNRINCKKIKLRLCGGGETALNNTSSGWGSPPASSNGASGNWGSASNVQPNTNGNNVTQQSWGNNNQRSQPVDVTMNPPGNNTNNAPNPVSQNNGITTATNSSSKIEQLNSMREALFSQDGWGGEHVNQDTNWTVPGSPEPPIKVDPAAPGAPPTWKPNINNGTDLWEANLRNGGQPPPQPVAKHPWGHTPATNIGGTWGEDDDAADAANVWTGPPPTQQWTGAPPQPPHWNQAKKDDWGAWGETHRPDPRLEHRVPPPDPRHELRGDMRGISGRLNNDMWNQHRPPAPTKPVPVNQWGAPPKEPSPPPVRRPVPAYDEAAVWAARNRAIPPPRAPPAKPDAVWSQGPRWEEPNWNEAPPAWPEAPLSWPKPKPPGWHEDVQEWAGPKPPPQGPPPKQPQKPYRLIPDVPYKKDEPDGRRDEDDYYNVYKTGAPPAPPGNFPSSQPSTQQLRILVEQIQMAVSAGYLNHQILNQPLAAQTLVLLNQLLQQIKVLQQLVTQHALAAKSNPPIAAQYSLQIIKTKQQISNLQNQIAAQQAVYVKSMGPSDPLSSLQSTFSEMSMKEQGYGGGRGGVSQSRLTQWKLPTSDGDVEFARAPGPAKPSPGFNPMEATWPRDSWNADSDNDVKEWPNAGPVYDLVPEFEPGKPWKGNPVKSAEEDPALTPGAVLRAEGKASPAERTLSSATWSYPAPHKNAQIMPPNNVGGPKWPEDKPRAALAPRPRPAFASTWLLLKNLTAQIDGSTLKTLCMQHGPLQNFHLYLNQGIALARYSSREEASKAQTALNNCVLSNTTIFAESPADSDVQMILQHLGQGGGGGGSWRDPWPVGVQAPHTQPPPTHAPLWPDDPRHLNSYLPPDLLGGESI